MKIGTGLIGMLCASVAAIAAFSANAIELGNVQKKLDQFSEYNSCTEEERGSKFASVFLNFTADKKNLDKVERAVLSTDFREFEISFDHSKGEYSYSNIFGKEEHFEQLHTECANGKCSFNMVIYPKLAFPDGYDNTDLRLRFYGKKGSEISDIKRDIGRFDAYEFEPDLIPFVAFMEDGTIFVRKLPSKHEYQHYVVGLHIGLDDKKHEIDMVVNRDQAEEGVMIGYPGYSNVTYLGIYFEHNNYSKNESVSSVENKIELYDASKEFFDGCTP